MKKIKIALAGLGNVGKGVYEILQKDAKTLSAKTGFAFELVAVCARSKKDFVDAGIKFYQDPLEMVRSDEIDVIVELLGGEGVAKDLVFTALQNGKKIVTANKALIANHGFEIAKLCEKNQTAFAFEASVGGAIPVIKVFRESFISGQITEFYGIINGTCNFILSKMQSDNRDFKDVLQEAQKLGFAEADPSFDIDGIDAAHKLAILSAIAGSLKIDFAEVPIEGITKVAVDDINLAAGLGYKIKLLGIYKNLGNSVLMAVYPALISDKEKIAQIDGSLNAILTNNSNADWNLMIGKGAGSLPTASSVIADLVGIVRGHYHDIYGVKSADLVQKKIVDLAQRLGKYFLILTLDKELAKSDDFLEKIFANRVKFEKANFVDRNEEIICGFVTEEMREEELVSILSSLDKKLIKSAKFLRIEETNF
jgi:homoserine dehydrogenase